MHPIIYFESNWLPSNISRHWDHHSQILRNCFALNETERQATIEIFNSGTRNYNYWYVYLERSRAKWKKSTLDALTPYL